jgi:hypothetical protein
VNNALKERYENKYGEKVAAFLRDAAEIDATGIPAPHLPLWGEHYEAAIPRIAFIGRDTRGWGPAGIGMSHFRTAARQRIQDALFMHENVFRELLFVQWTNNFGKTFWDTVMQLLAMLHCIPDWRQLKRRERDDILQTIMWAETNSVELWGSTPKGAGANFDAWQRFKRAGERHFDSFSTILDVFRPHLAVVLNWTVRDGYWDLPLEWQRIGDHVDYAFEAPHKTHVFHIAHPNWLRGIKRRNTFEAISRKWRSVFNAQ